MNAFTFDSARSYTATVRVPHLSFAARLAMLQARQQQAPHLTAIFGVAARFALAAIPVSGLAYLFVAL